MDDCGGAGSGEPGAGACGVSVPSSRDLDAYWRIAARVGQEARRICRAGCGIAAPGQVACRSCRACTQRDWQLEAYFQLKEAARLDDAARAARARSRVLQSVRRFFTDLWRVVQRSWWVARGERQRVLEENVRYRGWAEQSSERARSAERAVWELQASSVPCSVDVLRAVADEIDCDRGCETSWTDHSTNSTECSLSDRGECRSDKACQLRDLANALETYAAMTSPREPAV